MTTTLNKPVRRKSRETIRDAGRTYALVVTLYPNGLLGLRPERTRREELIPLAAVWFSAVKMRVAAEVAAKRAKRGDSRAKRKEK